MTDGDSSLVRSVGRERRRVMPRRPSLLGIALVAAAIVAHPRPAGAAIVLDDATSARIPAEASLTFSHTITGGADRLLVVCVAVEEDSPDADVANVTYNGQVMTKAIDRVVGATTEMNVEIWYMLDAALPPAGTYSVYVDCPSLAGESDIMATAISVTGAAQAGPEATTSVTDGETAATSLQTTLTTVTNEAWIFGCIGSGDPHPGFTADFDQLERFDVLGRDARMAVGTKERPAAGLETLGWSMPYSARSAYVLAAFAPAALPAVPAAPATINYRSIGTDSSVLYSVGDASVNSGASVVAFGGGATLPANVGLGDRLNIGSSDFSDDFTDGVITGWTDVWTDSLSESGGTLRAGSANDDSHYTVDAGSAWTDYTVTCDILADDNDDTGISFRAQDGSNFYLLFQRFGNPGPTSWNLFLQKVVGGVRTDLATLDNEGAAPGQVNSEGVWYTLKVVLSGTSIKCYVDDVLKFDITDSTYADGTVGAWCESQACKWDNMSVATGIAGEEFYILSRDSDTQVTVQETASSTWTNDTYTIERAYNTMQAWEDDRQGDLVTDDRREVGVCYNDGAFTDQLVISGSTTDAARYMRLTVADGERHEGSINMGAVIDAQGGWSDGDAITVEDEYTRIEWLEIKGIQDLGDGVYFSAGPAADNSVVSHVFTHSFWQNYPNAGVNVDAADVAIRNCAMTGGSSLGILVGAGGSATVESCTLVGTPISGHGVYTSAGTVGIVNTISVDHGAGFDFYVETAGTATLTSFGYNMYTSVGGGFDPADYQGGNQSPPADLADLFWDAAGADYHLATNNDAIDNGLDLSGRGFSIDLDNYPRLATWDIGADQCNTKRPARLFRRSIGTETLPLYSTGTATIEPYSSVVTFGGGASLPADVGTGDELIIGSTTYYLLARDSATQVRVQEAPTVLPQYAQGFTISRAYNSPQDWETDRSGNLFVQNTREIGICYDDGPFTGPVVFDGALTIPQNNMVLTVAPGHRHHGTAGTGVVIDAGGGVGVPPIEIRDVSVDLEWLEVTNVLDDQHAVLISGTNATHQKNLSNLLVHDFGSGAGVTGLRINGVNATARNCIVYDGARRGIVVTSNGTAIIENCTVEGMAYDGIKSNAGSTVEIRNTISVGNNESYNDFDLAGVINAFAYNMYSTTANFDPASFGGGNQGPPANLDDLFFSTTPTLEDLHLEPAGHRAGNWGMDLSGSFTGDLDGETRIGPWDIGADESMTGSGSPVIVGWQEIEP